MTTDKSHGRIVRKAAGTNGFTEVTLPSGRKLDALTANGTAIEVERSGKGEGVFKAIERLDEAKKVRLARKVVLKVPQPDLKPAAAAMQGYGLMGEVQNLTGSKSIRVTPPRKRRS